MAKVISSYNTIFDNFSFHHSVSDIKNAPAEYHHETHSQFEILYLVDGEIKYKIEGEEYLVKKGDVIFVSPNEIHSLKIVGGDKYERIVVMFDLDNLTQILSVGNLSLDREIFSNVKGYRVIPKELLNLTDIKKIMSEIALAKDEKLLPLYVLTKIFSLILELSKIFEKTDGGSYPLRTDKTVQSAIEYIEQNIHTQLSLEQIASALFVSKSTLCHKFVKATGVSVNNYVNIKKIYHSAKLIKQGMGVLEASLAVGYTQYTTFYHNYKKILGVSPSGK